MEPKSTSTVSEKLFRAKGCSKVFIQESEDLTTGRHSSNKFPEKQTSILSEPRVRVTLPPSGWEAPGTSGNGREGGEGRSSWPEGLAKAGGCERSASLTVRAGARLSPRVGLVASTEMWG